MAVIKLNSYKGVFADDSEEVLDVSSMAKAADYLTTLKGEEPLVLNKIRIGVSVITEQVVPFVTNASPAEAVTAGAKAYPETFSVKDGASVVFSAVAPATGFTFDGWYRDGVKVASTLVAAIVVQAADAGGIVTYTAKFVAA